jgi:hypothetical protein
MRSILRTVYFLSFCLIQLLVFLLLTAPAYLASTHQPSTTSPVYFPPVHIPPVHFPHATVLLIPPTRLSSAHSFCFICLQHTNLLLTSSAHIPPVHFPPACCPFAFSTCSSFSAHSFCLACLQHSNLLLTSSAHFPPVPFPHDNYLLIIPPARLSPCSQLLSYLATTHSYYSLPLLTFFLFTFLLLAIQRISPAHLSPDHCSCLPTSNSPAYYSRPLLTFILFTFVLLVVLLHISPACLSPAQCSAYLMLVF